MCLIAFAWRHHPRYPLVVAANRDEFHQRPTAPAAFWAESPRILAGRDLLGRGTWLGVTSEGRFAALTNLRGGRETRRDASSRRRDAPSRRRDPPSRGSLVSSYLSGRERPSDYLAQVARRAQRYNGFCLIAGDGVEMGYYCARDDAPVLLEPGIYGLSNARLDEPWPKVEGLKSGLASVLSRPRWRSDDLVALLGDRSPAPDEALPDTGTGLEQERLCSSAFIVGEHYGTRSSTVLTVDAEGRVDFAEQGYGPGGRAGSRAHFSFVIDAFIPARAVR